MKVNGREVMLAVFAVTVLLVSVSAVTLPLATAGAVSILIIGIVSGALYMQRHKLQLQPQPQSPPSDSTEERVDKLDSLEEE